MSPKASQPFRFKQFVIHHDRASMKAGTDAVLLGAWVNIDNASRILDIGTGTGVIALMLAQRTTPITLIDAVEIQQQDAEQAISNVSQSPWGSRVKVFHSSIQDFHPSHQFDLIVSNPPYFMNSLLPPSKNREAARHTNTLGQMTLIETASRLLKDEGRWAVILPTAEGDQLKNLAERKGWINVRATAFFSRDSKPQERWLLEFARKGTSTAATKLTLYDGDQWSAAYKELTKDFYL